MSGSPIIQDGKIIGAVTHVLVNDPRYGIAENIHADEVCLDDETMKKLNIDVNNQLVDMIEGSG